MHNGTALRMASGAAFRFPLLRRTVLPFQVTLHQERHCSQE
ncbi:hypothetical protein PH213_35575 [Streptomyces sp. SRF1]|nr:hypothetical protein [Streptomyces sp. SRF1]MDN3059757.1 hypothetical protein [Streptomyces sp. SRF1]